MFGFDDGADEGSRQALVYALPRSFLRAATSMSRSCSSATRTLPRKWTRDTSSTRTHDGRDGRVDGRWRRRAASLLKVLPERLDDVVQALDGVTGPKRNKELDGLMRRRDPLGVPGCGSGRWLWKNEPLALGGWRRRQRPVGGLPGVSGAVFACEAAPCCVFWCLSRAVRAGARGAVPRRDALIHIWRAAVRGADRELRDDPPINGRRRSAPWRDWDSTTYLEARSRSSRPSRCSTPMRRVGCR